MSFKNAPIGRPIQILAGMAGLLALIAGIAFLSGPGNQAAAAPGKAVYLGQVNAKRIPLCPQRCSGLAVVSGFQAKAGGIANAYRVPFVGNITRWRLKLGSVNMDQRVFFEKRFGTQPQAALGVLTKRQQGGKIVYKLRKRTPTQGLNRFLGKTATFDLPQPMKVNAGDYVALIVPTWAPALSVPPACQLVKVNGKTQMKNKAVCDTFNANNSWVASRERSTCNVAPTRQNSAAQIQINSIAEYGCRFNGALTYGVRVESR